MDNSPIILAVGANLASGHGTAAETVAAAADFVEEAGIRVVRSAALYVSPADPPSDQPDYVNSAMIVETSLAPAPLLARLHDIEARYGRQRQTVNEARPLDIDLIDYRGLVLGGAPERGSALSPVLPHPRAHLRSFVLRPISDVAPDWRHPISRRRVADMIAALPPGADTATLLSH